MGIRQTRHTFGIASHRWKRLRISVLDKDFHTFSGLAEWHPYLPLLRALQISGPFEGRNDFGGWVLLENSPLLKLRTLKFLDLHFLSTTESFASLLDVPCLEFRV